MFKLKSVAIAVVSLSVSVGAFADTFSLGALPVPSSTGVNPGFDLVNVPDGTSFVDTYNFSIGSGATVSAAIFNEAVDFACDSLQPGCLNGYEGGITGFAAMIDGLYSLALTGPNAFTVDGYAGLKWSLGLNQTFQIGAGAHTLTITGTTYNPGGSVYYGAVTLSPAAPVPEPESYAMMLAGLAALGFMASRRRQD